MYIRMKLLVGAIFLVIQLSSLGALDLDHANEDSLIDLKNPTSTLGVTDGKKQRDAKLHHGDSKRADKIVTDIESRRFLKALKKMQMLKNNDVQGTVNYVVHKVYNNNAGNFDLILQLVDLNQNETTSFPIYKALNYEMEHNNHNDSLLKLRLIKSFKDKNFNTQANPSISKFESELHKAVSNIIKEELKNAAKTKNSAAISVICENVHDNYAVLFKEVIAKVLNEAFDEINTEYLVKYFMSYKHPFQSMFTFSSVFNELKKRNGLDQSLVVTLAFGIEEALALAHYTDRETFNEGRRLREELPLSTGNLAMLAGSQGVGIVNQYGEYLYGASEDYAHDPERRNLFTWVPKDRIDESMWFIERVGDQYRIKNYRNDSHSEYMFRSTIPPPDNENTKHVFTWIPGGREYYMKNQYEWLFEPSGDNVYIRSEASKEYLFAKDSIKHGTRRYVFTHPSKKRVDGSLWTIVRWHHKIE